MTATTEAKEAKDTALEEVEEKKLPKIGEFSLYESPAMHKKNHRGHHAAGHDHCVGGEGESASAAFDDMLAGLAVYMGGWDAIDAEARINEEYGKRRSSKETGDKNVLHYCTLRFNVD